MKIIKRLFIYLIAILIVSELAILISGKTFLNKVFVMTLLKGRFGPDIDEMDKFQKREIQNGIPQPWPISKNIGLLQVDESILEKCEEFKTVSLLVIKNDSIIYEKYWENYSNKSYSNSFSMAKSFVGALIGIALKEGKIKSLDEPVGNYIPEFDQSEKSKILIKHLLSMSSGLDFNESYNSPFAWPSESYYGADGNALTLKANIKSESGKIWIYKGGDTQLLGMLLKKATGKNVADYASEKLWKVLGAEYPAFWSLDEKGMEKVSCCWYTNARDFARIAKLYMQYGNWNGQQIIDTNYIQQSLSFAPLKKRDGAENDQYGYQWWMMKYKGHEIFYCRGILGQYIFAIPDEKMIVVRLGHKRAKKIGDELPKDIFVYLDAALQLK